MALQAPALGGTVLAKCRECTQTEVFIGKQEEAHDGTLITDYTALKNRWAITWTMRTEAERNTIRTKYDVTTSQAFTAPDGGTATVVVIRGSWDETKHLMIQDGNPRYDINFEVEEAS